MNANDNSDDQTHDEQVRAARDYAIRAGQARNVRRREEAADDPVVQAHARARAMAEERAADALQQRHNLVNAALAPVDQLAAVKDPTRKADLKIDLARLEAAKLKGEDDLAIRLIRESVSTELCPYQLRDGTVCGRPVVGGKIMCKIHWGRVMRIPEKLPPDEREKIKRIRKRARESAVVDTNLDLLLAQHVGAPAPARRAPLSPGIRDQVEIRVKSEAPAPVPVSGPCLGCGDFAQSSNADFCRKCEKWCHAVHCMYEHNCIDQNE